MELGDVRPCGEPPLVEDMEFEPARTRKLGRGHQQAFWKLLNEMARRRLTDLFGKELVRAGNGMATPAGAGKASLGCLLPAEPPELRVNEFGRIRIEVEDTDGCYTLSVTDLRLHHPEDNSVNQDAVRELSQKLKRGEPCVLSMGLTRPWTRPGDSQSRHWLQVNGIHLERD